MDFAFIIAKGSHSIANIEIDGELLNRLCLFKSLSLLEAKKAEVNVPPTLLMLDYDAPLLSKMISKWKLPVMIRIDYRRFPQEKPLGGIPLYSLKAISSICRDLLDHEAYPLFHPYIDRFSDIYSVGILIAKDNPEVQVEVVGKGFDASDLRLGTSNPHETFTYDILNDKISNRKIVSDDEYQKYRFERMCRVSKLHRYIKFANEKGKLLASFKRFREATVTGAGNAITLPERYSPISKHDIKFLAGVAWKLQTHVIPKLPASDSYVASLSLIPGADWILWDMYGHWYKR